MNRKEAVEFFVSVWKLEYGYDWVDWDTAMNFKYRVWVGQPKLIQEYGIHDMIVDGVMEKNIDPHNPYIEAVRLKKSEPVSIK